jgi:hypothetical protein
MRWRLPWITLDDRIAESAHVQAVERIVDLEDALRALVADCDDYAKINNLAGTWATIERARALLVQ